MRSNGHGKPLSWRFREIRLDIADSWDELQMQREAGSFKWRMVWDFIQGTFRFYFPELVRKGIMDQIKERERRLLKLCVTEEQCSKCGCSIPEVMYANKGCYCYPKIKGIWKIGRVRI